MNTADEMRKFLDHWAIDGTVQEITTNYPDCICESASSSKTGHGPVINSEKLRYLVTSRSDIDYKREPKKPVSSKIFKRMFKDGMSVIRLDFASRMEINETAKNLHEYHTDKSGEYGGIIGVVDFVAKCIRFPDGGNLQCCCVLETPLLGKESHADVIHKTGNLVGNVQQNFRNKLFNSIGGLKAFKSAENVKDCDISDLIPEKKKQDMVNK